MKTTEVLIIGGGPGGTAAAMLLIKEGLKPIIVEQEEFPRFHIGESMTGEAGAVLRRLGLGDAMVERQYPVKYGVRVFGTSSWFIPVARRDEKWKLHPASTWQVRRSDFDAMMRERDYDHPDDYSIPIGSRYHPERAPLWEPDSPVEGTEQWISEAVSARQELAGAK